MLADECRILDDSDCCCNSCLKDAAIQMTLRTEKALKIALDALYIECGLSRLYKYEQIVDETRSVCLGEVK